MDLNSSLLTDPTSSIFFECILDMILVVTTSIRVLVAFIMGNGTHPPTEDAYYKMDNGKVKYQDQEIVFS
jgi:hypothetical protein